MAIAKKGTRLITVDCHSFEHYSSLIPDWWSSNLEVDEATLTAYPTAIEAARQAQVGK